MANGPLGGFMPTPPSPGQPPQVKLETSAESRGAFNKFLGTLPSNGAVAPIQTGVVPSSTAPVSPVTSNVNIFQPQMSQMAPMAPMPMMPPAQPVQNFFMGGAAMSGGGFSDADIGSQIDSFDSGQEDSGNNFDEGFTEEEDPDRAGDYQTDDSGIFTGTGGDDSPPPVDDDIVKTNIRNVGTTGRMRYDPEFALRVFSQSTGTPVQELLDRGYGERFGIEQPKVGTSTGLPSLSLGQNLLDAKPTVSRQDVLTAANRLSDIVPAASVPLAPTSPFFDRDLLDDPLGLGIRTGFGPAVDAIEAGRARARAFPSAGTPVASLRGGVDRLIDLSKDQSIPPSITTIEDDLIQGRGLGENINNPGNIRSGGGFDGEIGRTRDGFAIFDNIKSGVDAINKLSTTYGKERNINTVREYANRYSPVGENTAKEVAGKINILSNALGVGPDEKVDFTDPDVQAKLTPAIITSEIGPKRAQNVANVLRGFDPKPLDDADVATEPFTSFDVARPVDQGIIPVGEFNVSPPPVVPDEGILPVGTFDVTESNRQRIDREQRAIQNRGGRPVFNLGPGQPGVDIRGPLAARLASVLPDQALETLEGARLPDQVLDIDTRSIQPLSQSAQVQELLNRGARAQELSDIQRALDRGIVAEDLDRPISFVDSDPVADSTATTDLTRGPQVSIVGDDPIAPLETRDIVGDVTQERVADILNRPDRFKETFKIGDVEFPNLIATLANKAGTFFDRRLFDAIVKKGLDAVVDPDTGRIIGAKDEFGNLIEGRDLEQFQPDDGGGDPVAKFLKKATEDKEEEKDTTPNVFGGGTSRPLENVPTVVSSPFQARDINFRPVGFDAGNLNKLIERITGVPSPRGMQDGGQVQAVDRFLSKVA
tara:strand:+ start:5290 stop:7926 length:2637 start_codon:yes stop_codon:yes gene_type:complete